MAFDVREYTKQKRQGLITQATEEKPSGSFGVRKDWAAKEMNDKRNGVK